MFEVSFCAFLLMCFPLFSTPVSLIGVLLILSFMFVGLLSLFGSFWYSYILFLIYVGGLLVLFIYVCLVSSNISMGVSSDFFVYILFLSILSSFLGSTEKSESFLGFSSVGSGVSLIEEKHISLFLFLVVLLLCMLLVVVRVSGAGSAISTNEV